MNIWVQGIIVAVTLLAIVSVLIAISDKFPHPDFSGAVIAFGGTIFAGWLAWAAVQRQLAEARVEGYLRKKQALLDEVVAFDHFLRVAHKLKEQTILWDQRRELRTSEFLNDIKLTAANVETAFSTIKGASAITTADAAHRNSVRDVVECAFYFARIAASIEIDAPIFSQQEPHFTKFRRQSEIQPTFDRLEISLKSAQTTRSRLLDRLEEKLSAAH